LCLGSPTVRLTRPDGSGRRAPALLATLLALGPALVIVVRIATAPSLAVLLLFLLGGAVLWRPSSRRTP